MSRQGASCIIGLPSMVKELYCSAFLGFRFFYSIWSLVVRERRLWQMFSELCLPESRDSCYLEEQYLPTLLDMADPAGGTRYTLTRINWTDSVDGDPHTYVAPEVSLRLIAELRQSNNSTYEHVFARKFAPDCLGPLMAIADTVIFKN